MDLTIRKGEKEDIPVMMKLIVELAVYEKEPDAVINTKEHMLADGFGEQPVFGSLIAEMDGQIIGTAIYYYRYSTWKGKRLYLEDLIVTESHRGQGVGKKLFEATLEIGKQTGCTGMMWQVLDWNQPAINFYKKYDTHFDEGWVNCNVDF